MSFQASDLSLSLSQLQRWMQSVITHPAGIEAGAIGQPARSAINADKPSLSEIIPPSQRLGSADRLRVYGNAYFARLLECLRAEFPAMVAALGESAFDGLAFGYLLEHPSESYTLARLASQLPTHLARTRPPRDPDADPNAPDFADFLIDLATLERTYSEVFDSSGPEHARPLTAADFEGLSVEKFSSARLVLHDCVRLLVLRFPVHLFASAVRQQGESELPDPRLTHLVVTRREFVVRRIEVSPIQFALLAALQKGDSIGNAIENIQTDDATDVAQLANDLRHWFHDWAAAPLFQRVEFSESLSERRALVD